jgi:hypothetical protein
MQENIWNAFAGHGARTEPLPVQEQYRARRLKQIQGYENPLTDLVNIYIAQAVAKAQLQEKE